MNANPTIARSTAVELNLDGLVGPTHHYGGLGVGNLASQRHRHEVANPRTAALEGLAKMRLMVRLGLRQAVLPPRLRPDVASLRRIGFSGTDGAVLAAAAREAPDLLSAVSSTSSMWAANAATVSPAADTGDGRLHLTPANLVSQWHRSLETKETAALLKTIFHPVEHFTHHAALPAATAFADEGAANHVRLATKHDRPGIEIFTFGREGDRRDPGAIHPARQTRAASAAVARLHGLDTTRTLLLQQSRAAIDAGVFHNDVIAVGNEDLLLVHERAWAEGPAGVAAHRDRFREATGTEVGILEVTEREIPLAVAVETYLFNSQLVSLPEPMTATGPDRVDGMALICPAECFEHPATRRWLEAIVSGGGPITAVHAVPVRQSMNNGGGPACLRLRVVLTPEQMAAVHPGVIVDADRIAVLEDWVRRHYRDRLTVADLADPSLLEECRRALDELEGILGIGLTPAFPRQT